MNGGYTMLLPNNSSSLSQHDKLHHHLLQNPELTEVLNQDNSIEPTHWQRILKQTQNLVTANPDEFHGTTYVTPELRQHSEMTARVVTISSLLDAVTNMPILFYAFKDIGFGPAFVTSLLTNVIILKFTNDCASGASGHKKLSRNWAKWATTGLIFMNALQSAVSGVGVELLNNANTLSALKASEIIQAQNERIKDLQKLDSPSYRVAKQECEQGKTVLNTMKRSHPRWNSLYTELFGVWSQQTRDWKLVENQNRPICVRAKFLAEEASKNYELAKREWETLQREGASLDEVSFVREKLPQLYSHHFHPDDSIKSGVEAVHLATQNFMSKLMHLEWSGLGFSFFFFALSTGTSGTACMMAITHARRKDTQLSRNEVGARERDLWLQEQWEAMTSEHEELDHNAAYGNDSCLRRTHL
jgi:hypothetical protein